MFFDTYTYSTMPNLVKSELFKYRYDVFVDILKWDLDTPAGIERDEFDNENAVYVVSRNEQGTIIGCARLLPTTQPYLLSEVFPQLLSEIAPPASSEIWELSRFTTIDVNSGNQMLSPRAYSQVTRKLLDASLECARQCGAERVISVSPISIERLVRMMGYGISRMGPVVDYDGHIIVACNIDL